MSAAYLPAATGEKYSPCPDCKHLDCARLREDIARICRLCGKPMGGGCYYYNDDEGKPGDIVHHDCLHKHLAALSPK